MIEGAYTAFAALLFVLALLLGLFWLIRRLGVGAMGMGKAASEAEIEILEVKSLDPRNRLLSVKWQGRRLLIGVGPEGPRLLDAAQEKNETFGALVSEDQAMQDKA